MFLLMRNILYHTQIQNLDIRGQDRYSLEDHAISLVASQIPEDKHPGRLCGGTNESNL